MRRRLRRTWGIVGPSGRGVLGLAAGAWAIAHYTGLIEYAVLALLCVVLLLLALPFVLAPTRVQARIVLRPTHTMAGEEGVAQIHLVNRGPVPLLWPAVRLPIGRDEVWQRLPTLRPGRPVEQDFVVPTRRRGVIDVGPVGGRRTDPLGLLRREAEWGRPAQLYVRPRMVSLESTDAGFLTDLDGAPSDEMSMSDLSFHALREYVRGDDLRHVHWRSSARAGQLLVRQFHQSRRNHATVLLDDRLASYNEPEAFELAVSIAASLVLRATQGQTELTFVCGPEVVIGRDPSEILDACCRVQAGAGTPSAVAGPAAMTPDTSLLLVTGALATIESLGQLRAAWPAEVPSLTFRAAPGSDSRLRDEGRSRAAQVGDLLDLPQLVGQLRRDL